MFKNTNMKFEKTMLTEYTGKEETVIIPQGTTAIAEKVFFCSTSVKQIQIPDSVTQIGKGAFSRTSLEKIVLPAGLQALQDELFEFCYQLKKVVLPEGLLSIGENAFAYCSKLTSLEIPSAVRWIGSRAFRDTALEEIILPPNLEFLQKGTFFDCRKLHKVILPAGLTGIGGNVFSKCEKLKTLDIPSGVRYLYGSYFHEKQASQHVCDEDYPSEDVKVDFSPAVHCIKDAYAQIPYSVPKTSNQQIAFGRYVFFYDKMKKLPEDFKMNPPILLSLDLGDNANNLRKLTKVLKSK